MKTTILLLTAFLILHAQPSQARECVVLLHGLARSSDSMNKLEGALAEHGYFVVNVDYPSRSRPIEELAEMAVPAGIDMCRQAEALPINFVTHSLGGILVRQYFSLHEPVDIDRVVMLGPPNHGSEAVDRLENMPGFDFLNGPAGNQLGTDADNLPNQLGPVNFELGVIAGTRSINFILSTFLPDTDDGKVTVESTKIDGMCGFVTLPATHPFMMQNNAVISEVIRFLDTGEFEAGSEINQGCEW